MRLNYLQVSKVKARIHQEGNQITADALVTLDKKVEDIIVRSLRVWNGGHRRITSTIINHIIK